MMSDPGIVIMFLGSATACVAVVRTIGNIILKLKHLPPAVVSAPSPMSEDRMIRLEAAVEAIAIEVERISEGQRFTTKLLSENSQRVSAPSKIGPGKFDTPH